MLFTTITNKEVPKEMQPNLGNFWKNKLVSRTCASKIKMFSWQ